MAMTNMNLIGVFVTKLWPVQSLQALACGGDWVHLASQLSSHLYKIWKQSDKYLLSYHVNDEMTYTGYNDLTYISILFTEKYQSYLLRSIRSFS